MLTAQVRNEKYELNSTRRLIIYKGSYKLNFIHEQNTLPVYLYFSEDKSLGRSALDMLSIREVNYACLLFVIS